MGKDGVTVASMVIGAGFFKKEAVTIFEKIFRVSYQIPMNYQKE